MQQIEKCNAILDGTSKSVGGMSRWSPMAKADEAIKPDTEFKDLDYFGDLDGPDGKLWYYTAKFDYERIEHNNDFASYVDFIMHGFQFDIYDSEMNFVGTVRDKVTYAEHEIRVRQADLAPIVTRNFFNTDDKYEIIVGLIYNTDFYVNRTYTKIYSINGQKDGDGNDVCIQEIPKAVGDVLDASTPEKENIFVTFMKEGTDYQSTGDDEDINTNYWDKYLGNYTQLETYASATDQTGPRLINTAKVHLAQLPGDMQDSPIVISYARNGEPYFAFQYYKEPFYNRFDSYDADMSQREGNSLVVDIYKATDNKFEPVQTTAIPTVRNTANDKVIASYYAIGMLNYRGDIIDNGTAPSDFVVTRMDYVSSSDNYIDNFYRYNAEGVRTNTIFEGADSYIALSDIKGHAAQTMFVNPDAYGDYQFNFVDMDTYKTVLTMSYLMEMEDADPERLTANMDRVAVGDSYLYACELRVPSVDEDDNNHLRVMWFDNKGKFSRIDEVNIGKNVNYATVYMSSATLDPHYFSTDDNHEYMMLIKRAESGSSAHEELLIGKAINDDNPNGKDLLNLGPDAETGDLATIIPLGNRLLVSYKKSVDSRDLVTARYYALPLTNDAGVDNIVSDADGEGFAIIGDSVVATGDISVYNISGVSVAGGNGSVSLNGLQPGIYVVRAGGKTGKIAVH